MKTKNIILITGCSKGIGLEVVKELLYENSENIIIGISRTVPLMAPNSSFIHLAGDLSDVKKIKEIINKVDALINQVMPKKMIFISNACSIITEKYIFNEVNIKKISLNILMNIHAPYVFSEFLINKSENFCKLKMINISSNITQTIVPGLLLYGIVKSSMDYYFTGISKTYKGVISENLEIGTFDTDMQKQLRNKVENPRSYKFFKKLHNDKKLKDPKIAAQKILGKIEEYLQENK